MLHLLSGYFDEEISSLHFQRSTTFYDGRFHSLFATITFFIKLRKQSDFDTKHYLHFMKILTESFTDSTMVQKSGGGIVTKKLHEERIQEIGQYDNAIEIICASRNSFH